MKRKLLIIFFIFCSFLGYNQNKGFYLISSLGYNTSNTYYQGLATSIVLGYDFTKLGGVGIETNTMYAYSDNDEELYFSSSETNTGITIAFHLYPLNLEKHLIDINIGYGLNMNYWINSPREESYHGSIGRYLYKIPSYGLGYFYSYEKFSLGFNYRFQYFKFYRDMKNQQLLLSIKKYF